MKVLLLSWTGIRERHQLGFALMAPLMASLLATRRRLRHVSPMQLMVLMLMLMVPVELELLLLLVDPHRIRRQAAPSLVEGHIWHQHVTSLGIPVREMTQVLRRFPRRRVVVVNQRRDSGILKTVVERMHEAVEATSTGIDTEELIPVPRGRCAVVVHVLASQSK
jgi:hypothetical protein